MSALCSCGHPIERHFSGAGLEEVGVGFFDCVCREDGCYCVRGMLDGVWQRPPTVIERVAKLEAAAARLEVTVSRLKAIVTGICSATTDDGR